MNSEAYGIKTVTPWFVVLYAYRSEENEIKILSQDSMPSDGDMNPVPHENRWEGYIFWSSFIAYANSSLPVNYSVLILTCVDV